MKKVAIVLWIALFAIQTVSASSCSGALSCRYFQVIRKLFPLQPARLFIPPCYFDKGRLTFKVGFAAEEKLRITEAITFDPAPWLHIEAGSEQAQPVYLGLTPRDLALDSSIGLKRSDIPCSLPLELKQRGESQLRWLTSSLSPNVASSFQIEGWPAYDDDSGKWTWAWARLRPNGAACWSFISIDSSGYNGHVPMFAATSLRPWVPEEENLIFADFLLLPDLYQKPAFGNCIWSQESQESQWIHSGWLPLGQSEAQRVLIAAQNAVAAPGNRTLCRVLPQPARCNGKPVSYLANVTLDADQQVKISWPSDISFSKLNQTLPDIKGALGLKIKSWPADFAADWRADITTLDGELDAIFPISKKRVTFSRKNSADSQNQLDLVVDYLTERYKMLGLATKRQVWQWRNITQYNLIAVIPGLNSSLPPVLMADHFDTAFCEDVFQKTGQRKSAPGADDNASASATLLQAAKYLSSLKLKRDIWLVHLTGEEYPADDLGARHLLSQFLASGQDIAGMVLMDMISWRIPGDPVFQINAGMSGESLRLAALALLSSKLVMESKQSPLTPTFRSRFDNRSYLYNTDGVVLSETGFPVVLFNEHINREDNFGRPFYHQTTDLVGTLDIVYGSTVAMAVIETTAQIADAEQ